MSNVFGDIRYALRTLGKNPQFAAAAVLTMAIGIGANTAIFSVAYSLLWNPLDLPEGNRLVAVMEKRSEDKQGHVPISPANYRDWKSQATAFEKFGVYSPGTVNLNSAAGYGGDPERLRGARVNAEFFATVRVAPVIGHAFTTENEKAGHDRFVLLSDEIWRRRFAADPKVLGKTVILDGKTCEIAGVMPAVAFPFATDVWMPLALEPAGEQSRAWRFLFGIARLKPGATVKEANAQVVSIASRLEKQYPDVNRGWTAIVESVRDFQLGQGVDYVILLLGVVAFVLLIACVNLSNLQLAKATSRAKEFAIRAAMGARRQDVIRQVLIESTCLSAIGAIAGVFLASWSVELLKTLMPAVVSSQVPGWTTMSVNSIALAATVVIAVAAGLISGIVPALQSSVKDFNETLKDSCRGVSTGRSSHRLRNMLVAAELSLAIVLLVAAGLMAKTLAANTSAGPNLDPETLLTMRVALPEQKYAAKARVRSFNEDVLRNLNTLPGVASVSAGRAVPHSGHAPLEYWLVTPEGAPKDNGEKYACFQPVSDGYFNTVRIPLKRGRFFDSRDSDTSAAVAIVSEGLARRYFPGVDPIGRRIKRGGLNSEYGWLQIVGVAADVPQNAYDSEPAATLYVPLQQEPIRAVQFAVRANGDPSRLMAAAQSAVRRVDVEQPVFEVKTMQVLLDEEVAGLRIVSIMMTTLGLIALVLAAVGVFGVVSYAVAERTHEIGIRMALGASRLRVAGSVLRDVSPWVISGTCIGLFGATALARTIAHLLIHVDPADISVYVLVSASLLFVSAVAVLIPARRATVVDPMIALRTE